MVSERRWERLPLQNFFPFLFSAKRGDSFVVFPPFRSPISFIACAKTHMNALCLSATKGASSSPFLSSLSNSLSLSYSIIVPHSSCRNASSFENVISPNVRLRMVTRPFVKGRRDNNDAVCRANGFFYPCVLLAATSLRLPFPSPFPRL